VDIEPPIREESKKKEQGAHHRTMIVAAVEGGGTTFKVAVCEIADWNNDPSATDATATTAARRTGALQFTVLHRHVEDASDPSTCLANCAAFLRQHLPSASASYDGLGVACFGPVGVKPGDPATYGRILESTPKRAWRNVNVLRPLQRACSSTSSDAAAGDDGCPVWMDTDVNAPAFAEYTDAVVQQQQQRHRAADAAATSTTSSSPTALPITQPSTAITSCAYVTVGTGVGVGLVVNGATVHGRMHPEGGHVPVPPLVGGNHDDNDDNDNHRFTGYSWGKGEGSRCPFGGRNTVEGLASSVALTELYHQLQQQQTMEGANPGEGRRNEPIDRDCLAHLPDSSEIWDHAANALAGLCASLLLTLSVERIVLGGGVMGRTVLLDKIRTRTLEHLNGYLDAALKGDPALEQCIVTSRHREDAGLVGAIVLAHRAATERRQKQQRQHAEDDGDDTATQMKQLAFRYGLWHGVLVGAVGTALYCKYAWRGGVGSSNSKR
jgi:fructokinase